MTYYIITKNHDKELDQYYYRDDDLYAFAYRVPEDVAALYKLKGYIVVVTEDVDVITDALYYAGLDPNDIRAWY